MEVLVALVVLAIAALGSAATLGFATRMQSRAAALREAYTALRAQAALVAAVPCTSIVADSVRRGDVTVSWQVDPGDGVVFVRFRAQGRGVVAELPGEVTCL